MKNSEAEYNNALVPYGISFTVNLSTKCSSFVIEVSLRCVLYCTRAVRAQAISTRSYVASSLGNVQYDNIL